MKQFLSNIGLLIVSMIFIGCAGNSSTDKSDSVSNEVNNTTVTEANTSEVTLTKGYLVDSPISGVSYSCGEITGVTTITGEFVCAVTPITFSIGGLELGTIDTFTEDGTVYPHDLVGVPRNNFSDSALVDLTRFLQSLDTDGNIDEAIVIPPEMAERFGEDANDASFDELADMAGVDLVSEEDAMEHLRESVLGDDPAEEGDDAGSFDGAEEESSSTGGSGSSLTSGAGAGSGSTSGAGGSSSSTGGSGETSTTISTIELALEAIAQQKFSQTNGRKFGISVDIEPLLFDNTAGLPIAEIINPFSIVNYEDNNATAHYSVEFGVDKIEIYESNTTWNSSGLWYRNGIVSSQNSHGNYTLEINNSIVLTEEGSSEANAALKVVKELNGSEIQTILDDMELPLLTDSHDFAQLVLKKVLKENGEEHVGDTTASLVFSVGLGDKFRNYFIGIIPENNCTVEGRELVKEYSADTDRDDHFGSSVAIHGDMVVASAPSVNSGGSVFVYRPSNSDGSSWSSYKLFDMGLKFGLPVDISTTAKLRNYNNENPLITPPTSDVEEKRIIIGDSNMDYSSIRDSGIAYIYEHNSTTDSWTYTTIAPSTIVENANFGASVAIDYSRVIVGAPYNHTTDRNGSLERAYIFEHNGTVWEQKAVLEANATYNNVTYGPPKFGHQVDIKGNYAAVSARTTNYGGGSNTGVVYLYKYDGTSWKIKTVFAPLITPVKTASFFGHDVVLGDGIVVISALSKSNISGVAYEGVVYIYDVETGALLQTLVPSDESERKKFGSSLDIDANRIIVGAYKDDDNRGAAYLFEQNISTGLWEEKFKLSGDETGDYFGASVGISCGRAVVGANLADESYLDQGAIHIYD